MPMKRKCPAPKAVVVFKPRPGELFYYQRNAREMKLKPLQPNDVGIVRGESGENRPGMPRQIAVVHVERTGRLHEIDCEDLHVRLRVMKR